MPRVLGQSSNRIRRRPMTRPTTGPSANQSAAQAAHRNESALSRQAPRLSPWWPTPSRIDASRKEPEMPDLIWIIVIVLVVLLLLGYFGRGRFRR
jgi:hypothetical protein